MSEGCATRVQPCNNNNNNMIIIIIVKLSYHSGQVQRSTLNIAVIQIYVPTSDSTEEDIEMFYEQLEHTIEEMPKKDVKIVIGDWNAKVEMDNEGWEHVMGCHGYRERNERGERLLEFASKNDLLITNTRFQQKDSRNWTWMAPDGKHTNMIDFVLVDRRWKTAVHVCRAFQGADISSDHSLVMCKLKLRS